MIAFVSRHSAFAGFEVKKIGFSSVDHGVSGEELAVFPLAITKLRFFLKFGLQTLSFEEARRTIGPPT